MTKEASGYPNPRMENACNIIIENGKVPGDIVRSLERNEKIARLASDIGWFSNCGTTNCNEVIIIQDGNYKAWLPDHCPFKNRHIPSQTRQPSAPA